MANLRIYRLTSTSVATALGQAATTVVNKGRIKQIVGILSTANCTATGNIAVELALNNSGNGNASISSLQSTDNLLVRNQLSQVTGQPSFPCVVRVDMNRPVSPGDVFGINVITTGTFGSGMTAYDVYVEEA